NKFIKYFILLMTIFFGLNGFAIGTTLAIIYLIRLQALETPYFWPFIPFNGKAMLLFIARIPLPKVDYRPSIVHARDRVIQQNTEESFLLTILRFRFVVQDYTLVLSLKSDSLGGTIMLENHPFNINEKRHLSICGADAVHLAEDYGNPLYVYDVHRIRKNCRVFTEAFKEAGVKSQVSYASKAFS